MMDLTENLFRYVAETTGELCFEYAGNNIDLSQPFKKKSMFGLLREYTDIDISGMDVLALNELAQSKSLELPEGMAVIVRTAGAERGKAEIKRDFEYLIRLWNEIRELTLESTAPALIHEEANIIFGAVVDSSMKGEVKITVIATGFDDKSIATSNASASKTPVDLETYAGWTQDVPSERVTTVSLAQRRVIQLPSAPASRATVLKVPEERLKKDQEQLETPVFLRSTGE